jgi:hypothetical protein
MYRVKDKDGTVVQPGDRVHYWNRSEEGVFEGVTQGPDSGKPPKVQVDGREHFAKAWQLVIERA